MSQVEHGKASPLRIAAIDLGSNSAHLVIAESFQGENFRVLDSEKIYLRLARELDENKNLSEAGIQAAVRAFQQMKEIASSYTNNIRAVATFATREARNHGELLRRIQRKTGITVEIIGGLEEARLEYLGVKQGLPIDDKRCLLVDIGGGSTEIMVTGAGSNEGFDFVRSLSLGAVTFTRMFLQEKRVTKQHIGRLEKRIDEILKPYKDHVRKLKYDYAIASSGTAKALATVTAAFFEGDDLSDPNGHVFSFDQQKVLYREFCRLGQPKLIKDQFNLDQRRAEIIIAGTAILNGISKLFDVEEWMISTYSLREGIVVDTFEKLGRKVDVSARSLRWHNVIAFGRQLNIDEAFGQEVSALAVEIYDGLNRRVSVREKHRIANERELLCFAAYLCETGKAISYPRYHKHSSYILENSSMMGFTQFEKQIMGHIVRYHRRSVATKTKALFCPVLTENLPRINFLAGCLRLATCLNRTRQRCVDHVGIRSTARGAIKVTIQFAGRGSSHEIELHQARQEASNLEKVFGRPVEFSVE